MGAPAAILIAADGLPPASSGACGGEAKRRKERGAGLGVAVPPESP